jgi:hypothetical protein
MTPVAALKRILFLVDIDNEATREVTLADIETVAAEALADERSRTRARVAKHRKQKGDYQAAEDYAVDHGISYRESM